MLLSHTCILCTHTHTHTNTHVNDGYVATCKNKLHAIQQHLSIMPDNIIFNDIDYWSFEYFLGSTLIISWIGKIIYTYTYTYKHTCDGYVATCLYKLYCANVHLDGLLHIHIHIQTHMWWLCCYMYIVYTYTYTYIHWTICYTVEDVMVMLLHVYCVHIHIHIPSFTFTLLL